MQREQIEEHYKWDLSAIYDNLDTWNKDYKEVKEKIQVFTSFKGKLHEADTLYNCLSLDEELSVKLERLYMYWALKKDEDTRNNEAQKFVEKVSNLEVEFSQLASFIVPEILTFEETQIENLIKENEKLAHYRKMIQKILRRKEHILSHEEEELLAKVSDATGVASEVFGMLNNADMEFPEITLANGEKVKLTKSNYAQYVESEDRVTRETAYKALYHTYMGYRNTIAKTLYSNIKENVTFSKIRRYPSALEKSLFHDNVPKEVYLNLIETTKKNLKPLQKYLEIRKNALNVDELRMWDIYVPLLKDYDEKISYEEAYAKMKEGLSVLGEDYIALLERAKQERWIDVCENEGKRGGAYSWGSYGTHPYVLLNHREDLNSLFTLAHEMGHSLHSYYSDEANPYLYAQYTIFVAEVASTVNEVLLMQHLLQKAREEQNKDMEKYLLNYFLEQFRGTLYRQTMFAEFEYLTHEAVENGQPLTADDFSEIYLKLHKEYYGDKVIHDEEISSEWMRIPHFYTPFYVYKYATGFSAAISIAKGILETGEPAVNAYKQFLKSGGTDFPIELLKIAGIDMGQPKPIEDALEYFGQLVDQFETLLSE